MGEDFKSRNDCRLCKSTNLYAFLDLGVAPLADQFTLPSVKTEFEKFPLQVSVCLNCGWHQLSVVVNPKKLYCQDYPYDSRTTETGELHWKEFASQAKFQISHIKKQVNVLDVGSNTGALLSQFKQLDCNVLGVDPSDVAAMEAKRYGIETVVSFFEPRLVVILNEIGFKPDLVVSTNSFAHVDDLDAWVSTADKILTPEGVIVIEFPHVLSLLRDNQFDTIYHEHLSYGSLGPLLPFFEKFGFKVYRVEKYPIHGGSVRIYLDRGYKNQEESVFCVIQEEKIAGISTSVVLNEFSIRVSQVRDSFKSKVESLVKDGFSIGIASAPAKGVTFSSVTELTRLPLVGISDKSNLKVGRCFPGTSIPVITDLELVNLKPDYIIILAWNFKGEIKSNLRRLGYTQNFITGIPHLEVVNGTD